MLCLDCKQFSLHRGTISIPPDLKVDKEDLVALYVQSSFLIYRIKDLHLSDYQLTINLQYDHKKEIDHRLGKLITANPVQINDTLFQKILELSGDLKNPPLQIHFKKKTGQYQRIMIIDPIKNLFIEKYLNWDDYRKIEKEFLEAKEKADQAIRKTGFRSAISSFEWMKKTAGQLFEKTSIPVDHLLPGDFNRSIDVFMSGSGWVPPLDVLFFPHFVRYRLSGKEAKMDDKASSLFFYSEQLKGGQIEALKLSEIAEGVSPTGVFPDSHFSTKKPELTDAGMLHFTGHGTIRDGQSFLKIGDLEIQDIPVSEKLGLAFLHCCHTGTFSEGIIGSLIQNGAQCVIACPLEMPDENYDQSIENFYKAMPILGPELSFRYISAIDSKFPLYYRYFSPYRDKI